MINIEILTTKEVAELVREDKRTIERKAQSGFYPSNVCSKHGRFYKFHKQNLINFLFPVEG